MVNHESTTTSNNTLTFVHGSSIVHSNPPEPVAVKLEDDMAVEEETSLNRAVKGAPPPELSSPPPPPPLQLTPATPSPSQESSTSSPSPNTNTSSKYTPQSALTDPHLSTLPSAPPQIYLNLLILESSLRSQYLHLLSRRRLNTFFLLLLFLWTTSAFYLLFLRPREDGHGRGGSVYWFVETSEKIALLGGVVTVLLVWGTGQWERGVRWPRRWLGVTNRGLRGFNLRVVVVRGPWWREWPGHMSFLLPFGLFREAGGSDWNLIEHEAPISASNTANTTTLSPPPPVEEDLAPGGDHVMLLLQPKSFSAEFRENWEGYRADYWEKENERRRLLVGRVRVQKRTRAKEFGGWRWWTGSWRIFPHHLHHHHLQHLRGGSIAAISSLRRSDTEKHQHHHHHYHGSQGQADSQKRTSGSHSRRRGTILPRSGSQHSRNSSRSNTPTDLDGTTDKPLLTSDRTRRGSGGSVRRKTREGTLTSGGGGARNSLMLSPLSVDDDKDEKVSPSAPERRRRKTKDRDNMGLEEGEGRLRGGNGGTSRSTTPGSDNGEGSGVAIKAEPL